MRWLLVALLLAATSAYGAAVPQFDDPALSARYQSLTEELRCVICLNQSIASSTAPLALDMRRLVAERIRAGDSNAEIKKILVNRYGTFVLYEPPFVPETWALWLGPAALLLVGLLIGGALLLRSRKLKAEPVAVDQERLQQLLRETERGEQEP